MAVDQSLVRRFRSEVADALSEQRRADQQRGRPPLAPEDERELAQAVIGQVLEDHARGQMASGQQPLSASEEAEIAVSVSSALFGVGRLQPLLEDESVENIDINGCDRVFLRYFDGRVEMGPPVADSDEELIELVQLMGAYAGLSSRPFDTAHPQLDLRLPDGSRLSAVMDVAARPAVSIRRNRLDKVFLSDLVGYGSFTADVQAFLSAAVAARKNMVIAGSTDAGKTTLLRALANEIDPTERLITVEKALELGLDRFPELHPDVVALEERLPNSEGVGAVTMGQLVQRSLRMNPSRVIVGEVLGAEIVTMLNAMGQGNDGSLSTIHAKSSAHVFQRIATYAIESESRLPAEASNMLIAGAIDFVVFCQKTIDADGSRRRRVASIREVNGVDGQVLSSEVYALDDTGRLVPKAPVSCLADLEATGYEPDRWGRWAG